MCLCKHRKEVGQGKKKKQIKRQIIHAQGCMVSKENRAAMISAMQSAVKKTGKEHTGRVVPVRMEIEGAREWKLRTRVNGIQMLLQVVQVKSSYLLASSLLPAEQLS